MEKRAVVFLLALTLFAGFLGAASAGEIDAPIQEITHYAEEYETGNINYAQMIVYITSSQQELAEAMGATSQGHDSVLQAGQLESAFGEPTEYTRYAWVDGENREKKLPNEAPAWRKPIFDGNKIQILLGAWPNILIIDGDERMFYRLHLDVQFKQADEDVDIEGKIGDITELAKAYEASPSGDALENLAKRSVDAEQVFRTYFDQNAGKCEVTINDLLGSESKKESQKLLTKEFDFFDNEKYSVVMKVEMCDDCNWNWININTWYNGRGGFQSPEEDTQGSPGEFKGLSKETYMGRTRSLIEESKQLLEAGDVEGAQERFNELRFVTEAWNEVANNVWEEFEGQFQVDFNSMTDEERQACQQEYCWLKENQKRVIAENELKKSNYEERKRFYQELFASYDAKETYVTQEQWEKWLVQTFQESGQETCDNNVDDNGNGQIDCGEQQCGGQVCGSELASFLDADNRTVEQQVALYCIESTCKQREEIIVIQEIACGNHICEEGEAGETGSCALDCAQCAVYEPLACAGEVIFSGKDAGGCPLEPVCLESSLSCASDGDCKQPLCGTAVCVGAGAEIQGTCQITAFAECREAECAVGEKRVTRCVDGSQIISSVCTEGLWVDTEVVCASGEQVGTTEEIGEISETETEIEEIAGACTFRSDCGGEHDVCSNEQCVTLPETRASAEQEAEFENDNIVNEENEEEQTVSGQSGLESGVTGNAISSFFKTINKRLTARVVEGEGGEGGETGGSGEQGEGQQQGEQVEFSPEEEERDREDERRDEERERRREECTERCDRECYDGKVRPCAEQCIQKAYEEDGLSVDESREGCESSCTESAGLESCTSSCFDKCIAGEDTQIEQEREERKMEKFVFTVGGSCREMQGREESSIYFGGWGPDFEDFHLVKNQFYSHGGGDWCERDLENLMEQRKELERSLNEKFAEWFFEQYAANSADDWQKNTGLSELYWRDVDISRQMTERLRCLGRNELPTSELINFKYETDHGSIEFWEEVMSVKLDGFENEVQIISPYMKEWSFLSRDFFKREMMRSMEEHNMPGDEGQARGKLSEEEAERFREDEKFVEFITSFNEKYGENLAIQFKDFETGEVAFNIYVRLNERELMYFEPMLPEEMPPVDLTIGLDVENLLDIVVLGESGRVELRSPDWDRRPEVGVVKGVVSGAQMYLKFRALMNSMQVTPEGAEPEAKEFMREFFGVMMGGDDREHGGPDEEQDEGPEGSEE